MTNSLRSGLLVLIFLAPAVRVPAESAARLVADLVSDSQAARAFPQSILTTDDAMYFVAGTELSGRELFRTDGTPEGTRLVRDFCPGRCSSLPFAGGQSGLVAELEGVVYVATCDGFDLLDSNRLFDDDSLVKCDNGSFRQLWRIDGEDARTIYNGDAEISSATSQGVSEVVTWNGDVYFGTFEGVVHRTDGTGPGTVVARTGETLDISRIEGFFATPDLLFFFAQGWDQSDPPGYGPAELWRTDGTAEGTFMVQRFADVDYSHAMLGGDLVFPAGEGILFRTDGESVKPLLANPPFSRSLLLHVIDEVLYLADYASRPGFRVWRTDGTAAGTAFLAQFPSKESGRLLSVVHDGELFFALEGFELLYRVAQGTSEEALIAEALVAGEFSEGIEELRASDHGLLIGTGSSFSASTLWRLDTEPASRPERLFTLDVGYFGDLVSFGDAILFRQGRDNDSWLARVGGNGKVTALTAREEARSSHPHRLASHRGDLLFLTRVPDQYATLRIWRSDASGTWRIGETHFPARFIELGEQALLFEENAVFTFSDGAGMSEVLTVPGQVIQRASARVGDVILFPVLRPYAVGPPDELDLWRTDGTAAGTSILATDIGPFDPYNLEFTADVAVGGGKALILLENSAWLSDGTSEGTIRLLTRTPECGFMLRNAVAVGDGFFFSCGQQLWRTDGTVGGSAAVFDLDLGEESYSSRLGELTAVGDRLFFAAVHRRAGQELWTSDGTAEGTRMVRDIWPGPSPSHPRDLTDFADRLVFTADDGSAGRELWLSDGTTEGTVLLRDIRPGPVPSAPEKLKVIDGRLVFTADDGFSGRELWVSDELAERVHLVQDLHQGSPSSNPSELKVVGDRLYFSAGRRESGIELWSLPLQALGEEPCGEDCLAVLRGFGKPDKP